MLKTVLKKNTRILAALFTTFVVLVLIWEEVLEDRIVPKRWGAVEDGSIYRSGQLHPALVERTLASNNIDVIINMNQWRLDKPAQAAEEAAADALGLEKARYPMMGNGTGDPEMYAQAVEHLKRSADEGQRVLVHCTAGAQRTGAVIALYRLLLQGWSMEDVLEEMETYDFDRSDDTILLDFLDTHIAFITERLVALDVIPNAPDPLPRFRS